MRKLIPIIFLLLALCLPAYAQHTVPLSALKQSGATTNQIPEWDGTGDWLPSTLAAGSGLTLSFSGGTFTFSLTAPVSVADGGTGQSSYTDGGLLIGDSLTGGLDVATLTAGSNVTITNGHGTITIASGGGGGGSGVTSVAQTMPSFFSVAGSPITTAGTLADSYATGLTANEFEVLGVDGTGAAGLYALTGSYLPSPSASTLGGIESITAASHEWIDSISTAGVPHQSQPGFSDLCFNPC